MAKKDSLTAKIADIIEGSGRGMTAAEVLAALKRQGWTTSAADPLNTVSSTMCQHVTRNPADSRFLRSGRNMYVARTRSVKTMKAADAMARLLAEANRPMAWGEVAGELLARGWWRTKSKDKTATLRGAAWADARLVAVEGGRVDLAKRADPKKMPSKNEKKNDFVINPDDMQDAGGCIPAMLEAAVAKVTAAVKSDSGWSDIRLDLQRHPEGHIVGAVMAGHEPVPMFKVPAGSAWSETDLRAGIKTCNAEIAAFVEGINFNDIKAPVAEKINKSDDPTPIKPLVKQAIMAGGNKPAGFRDIAAWIDANTKDFVKRNPERSTYDIVKDCISWSRRQNEGVFVKAGPGRYLLATGAADKHESAENSESGRWAVRRLASIADATGTDMAALAELYAAGAELGQVEALADLCRNYSIGVDKIEALVAEGYDWPQVIRILEILT